MEASLFLRLIVIFVFIVTYVWVWWSFITGCYSFPDGGSCTRHRRATGLNSLWCSSLWGNLTTFKFESSYFSDSYNIRKTRVLFGGVSAKKAENKKIEKVQDRKGRKIDSKGTKKSRTKKEKK